MVVVVMSESAKDLDLFMISDDELAQHAKPRTRVEAAPEPEPAYGPGPGPGPGPNLGWLVEQPGAVVLPFRAQNHDQGTDQDQDNAPTSPPCPDCGGRWAAREPGPPPHWRCTYEGTRFTT